MIIDITTRTWYCHLIKCLRGFNHERFSVGNFVHGGILACGVVFAGETAYLVDVYRDNGKRICLYETSQGELYELVKQGEAGSCPRTHFFE